MKNIIKHFLIPVIIVALFFWGIGYLIISVIGWEFNIANWPWFVRALFIVWCVYWIIVILDRWGKKP